MSYPKSAQRKGGQHSRSHGIYAIEARGEAALDDVGALEYRELRQALRDPQIREEIKLELVARLVVMMRAGFDQMGVVAERGGDPFGAPVVGRLGSYMNLLARLLGSFPVNRPDSLADEVDRIKALITDAERAKETQVEDDPERVETPQQANGETQEGEND